MAGKFAFMVLAAQLLWMAQPPAYATEPDDLGSKLGTTVHNYNLTAPNFIEGAYKSRR